MIYNDQNLADFQDSMVTLLYQENSTDQVVQKLLKIYNEPRYLQWVEQLNHQMLIVAMLLTKKWALVSSI